MGRWSRRGDGGAGVGGGRGRCSRRGDDHGVLESAWDVGVVHRGPQSTMTTEGVARPRRRERGHGRGPLDEGDRRRGPREGVGGGAQRGECRPGRRTIGEAVERRRQSRGGEQVEEEEQGF